MNEKIQSTFNVHHKLEEGSWRAENENLTSFRNYFKNIPRRTKESAEAIQNEFAEYFYTVGAVPWQFNAT
jgi:hypothetical protein